MTTQAPRIGIVVGEASGDTLGAGLIHALKKRYPNATFEGVAGPKMIQAGASSLFAMEELSVMGFVAVIKKLRTLLALRKQVIQHFIDNPPDIFIGIDAPDFNLTVETKLKEQGIKTVHYVSPTVWAWREKRIFKIAKATNMVLGLFPFEGEVYKKHNIPYTFVGHTLAEEIPLQIDTLSHRKSLSLPQDKKILAMLPGSRAGEVNALLPIFIESVISLHKALPNFMVVIPAANTLRKKQIEQELSSHELPIEVRVLEGQAREVMLASDAVLLASGTATLEAMLCKKPMIAAYRLKFIEHFLMGFLYKAKYFALPNILADKLLIPELLQEQVNSENIANLLLASFEQDSTALLEEYVAIHKSLKLNADEQSAQAVSQLMESHP